MSVTFVDKINAAVALSPVGTWFRLEGCGHPKEREGSRFLVSCDGDSQFKSCAKSLETELRAGLTTWVSHPSDSCGDYAEWSHIGVGRDGVHCQ